VSLKKLIPILFLSLYLVSVTELHELFKLPKLVEHFIEHKTEDKKTTFIDYLVMHYSSSNDNDGDGNKDMKLPFKSNDSCENSMNVGFISFNNCHLTLKPAVTPIKKFKIFTPEFISSSYLSTIWQPPKVC
jgi:hypothetical protein